MAVYKIKQNGNYVYGITEFIIDCDEDLDLLPKTAPGSKAYDPNTGSKYILTNALNWILEKENVIIGGGEGTNDYNQIINKPSINDIVLSGNKTLEELGIQAQLTEENLGDFFYVDENGILSLKLDNNGNSIITNDKLVEEIEKINRLKANRATTLAGYGITDALSESDTLIFESGDSMIL